MATETVSFPIENCDFPCFSLSKGKRSTNCVSIRAAEHIGKPWDCLFANMLVEWDTCRLINQFEGSRAKSSTVAFLNPNYLILSHATGTILT